MVVSGGAGVPGGETDVSGVPGLGGGRGGAFSAVHAHTLADIAGGGGADTLAIGAGVSVF